MSKRSITRTSDEIWSSIWDEEQKLLQHTKQPFGSNLSRSAAGRFTITITTPPGLTARQGSLCYEKLLKKLNGR